jgi:hypothetical protein
VGHVEYLDVRGDRLSCILEAVGVAVSGKLQLERGVVDRKYEGELHRSTTQKVEG